MGTRSTITFLQKDSQFNVTYRIVTIYQQYDGYLDGVGKALCKWLQKKKIIKGIGFNQYTSEYANGVGCLAAQFIRDFKEDVGGLYIYPTCCEKKWIDYNYDVIIDDDVDAPTPLQKITKIRVYNWDEEPFFEGTIEELMDYKESEGDE